MQLLDTVKRLLLKTLEHVCREVYRTINKQHQRMNASEIPSEQKIGQ